MSKEKRIDEVLEKIEVEKELLRTAPQNTLKNKAKYNEKVENLISEYEKYKEDILKVLENRYENFIKINKSEKIDNLESRLNIIEKNIYILNDYKTSYEKMELDFNIYAIKKYYKDKLENINFQIAECIKKFSEVGVELELEDFDYSSYVIQYMEVFFLEYRNNDLESEKLASKFEEIYWKCPEILIYIQLNLRNIYLKKKSQIDKFYEKEKTNLLKEWEKTPEEILKTYLDLKKEVIEEIAIDKKFFLDQFIEGKLNLKDFSEDKIKSLYTKILPQEEIEDDAEENEKNIIKFLNSLYEYKNYINFKYIIDDIKSEYAQKDKYKKAYAESKKKINVAEKKLKKISKIPNTKGFFAFLFKKKETKQIATQHEIIMNLNKLYKELDFNKFRYQICTKLTDNSTIYEILKLALSYYTYLIDCMIRTNPEITQEEIETQIYELKEFLKNPYNTIINNLTILEEKDVGLIIKDMYKLLNFLVEKEDMNLENIDNIISILEQIKNDFCLKKSGWELNDLQNILTLKKILKK